MLTAVVLFSSRAIRELVSSVELNSWQRSQDQELLDRRETSEETDHEEQKQGKEDERQGERSREFYDRGRSLSGPRQQQYWAQ